MGPKELLALLIISLIMAVPLSLFSIPLLMIWTSHRRKMEEIRLQRQSHVGKDVTAELTAIRAEIQALRDTTMQYDLSFDANLQQMERRLGHLEQLARTQPEERNPANAYVGSRYRAGERD